MFNHHQLPSSIQTIMNNSLLNNVNGLDCIQTGEIPNMTALNHKAHSSESKDSNKDGSNKARQKVKFSPEEDEKLAYLVNKYGEEDWAMITVNMDGRNIRQCRERWRHYLSPRVSNAPWTLMEDYLLEQKYAEFGPKWKMIAEFFPNRTDINIKNRYLLKQRHMEKLTSQIAEMSAELNAKKRELKKNIPIPMNSVPAVVHQNIIQTQNMVHVPIGLFQQLQKKKSPKSDLANKNGTRTVEKRSESFVPFQKSIYSQPNIDEKQLNFENFTLSQQYGDPNDFFFADENSTPMCDFEEEMFDFYLLG